MRIARKRAASSSAHAEEAEVDSDDVPMVLPMI